MILDYYQDLIDLFYQKNY